MESLDTEDYSLYYFPGRLLVRIAFWIAIVSLFIAGLYYSFMDRVDEEFILKVTMNALESPEGLLKFQIFQEIVDFPVEACTQLASFVFMIFSVIIATKLILRSKEFIGAMLTVASGICYFLLTALPEMTESTYSSLSLAVIILFAVTGVYLLVRGTWDSPLGIFSTGAIILGLEMIWPRSYHLEHHTLGFSGLWMAIITLVAVAFLLFTAMFLLCEQE